MKKIIAIILTFCLCIFAVSCKTKPIDNEIAQLNTEKVESNGDAANAENEAEQPDKEAEHDENKEKEKADNSAEEQVQPSDAPQENTSETGKEEIDNVQVSTEQTDKKEPSEPQSDGILHESYSIIIPSLKECVQNSTDIFVGKIISAQQLKVFPSSYGFDPETSIPVLYTVEVKEILKNHITTKGSIIYVLHFTSPLQKHYDGTETWADSYVVGQQYLIGGLVQPYNDKPIILDYSQLTASINEDGNITSKSGVAKRNFEKISTLSQLVEHEETKGLWENKQTDTAKRFRDIIPTDSKEELTEQEVIDYLKEAIKIDSDKVLKTPEVDE